MQQTGPSKLDQAKLNQQRWEKIAEFWDHHTQEGNSFYHQMVAPMALRLLNVTSNDSVVEFGCSTGLFSRVLSNYSKEVVGVDFCSRFIEIARSRSGSNSNLSFRQMDLTQLAEIKTLGEEKFDSAVCNMALMDVSDIYPIFQGLRSVLKKNGVFVATLLHPSFHGGDLRFYLESSIGPNGLVVQRGIKVQHYLTERAFEQVGILGQPVPHFLFHRPLEKLVQPAFENGFVITGIEERTLQSQPLGSVGDPLAREHFQEIPAIMGIRFRILP